MLFKYIHEDYHLSLYFLMGSLIYLFINLIYILIEYYINKRNFLVKNLTYNDMEILKYNTKDYNDIDLPYSNSFRNKISCFKKCNRDKNCSGMYIWENNDIIKCSVIYDNIQKSIMNTNSPKNTHEYYGELFIKNK